MQIGTVAKNTGLSPDAIRFYERCGLLEKPSRTEGGFRLYRDSHVAGLIFIRKAQRLGFSLDEIRELTELRRAGDHACSQVMALLQNKVGLIRRKIQELTNLEQDLRASLAMCRRQLRRNARPRNRCPVLNGGCKKGRA